ncbi:MAG TPA: Asp-tRNA(Asn)/Glu-tRNA(Gln) amidotransferase subunit GatB [Candidatus Saccharimonadales bacterium]|nr:Asp-tRNA(Asn)/Glu-tRNA(Gln) amidotransferase subunit GatB [Candidatus Saccharimonadales bacterium]
MSDYLPTIGIETHVQLKTKTKMFSAVGNDARDAAPNTLISHIDVGMPGALPVLNEKALELACRAAFALNTTPQKFSKFERKHYFYPDLPKGYQITQYENPIIIGGHVELPDGKKIGITRAHLEEDAGKNTHPASADYSLVDLNRAGTPLLEIVSEPDIHSAADAKAYVRELYLLMKYADVSDCDLYLGHMRFDVNVSVSKDPSKPGIRAEVKNLNSFRSVEAAIEYEIKRQTELLENGEKVVQETRGWDEDKQVTTSQRSKEEAEDYRYMPEPDIPPTELSDEFIENIRKDMPDLPSYYRKTLSDIGIDKKATEDIVAIPDVARNVDLVYRYDGKLNAKFGRRIAFLLLRPQPEEPDNTDAKVDISIKNLVKLCQMAEDGLLSSTATKEIFDEMLISKNDPELIAKEKKLIQVSDEGAIEEIVKQVIAENEKAANDVKNGEMKAISFLVGQVMAKSKGQANPGLAQAIIKKQLGV